MIDLHLHLDGSLSAQDVLTLAQRQNIALSEKNEEEARRRITVPPGCKSLGEYLSCFELPLSVLQTAQALSDSVYSLINRLAHSGMIYAEIRFAPQLHMQKGMAMEEACQAAADGLARAKRDFSSCAVQLIFCCMRGTRNLQNNLNTVELASAYRDKGVCAADLAGAEGLYPTQDFAEVFSRVRALELPFTIHAGEADGPQSIWAAVEMGATRIGHGVRAIEDERLLDTLIKKRITLECCPTSNVQTAAVPSIEEHPVLKLLERGVSVTVNTDNMTVSGTTLAREFAVLKERLHMSVSQEKRLLLNSARAAFLPQEKRDVLKQRVLQAFP